MLTAVWQTASAYCRCNCNNYWRRSRERERTNENRVNRPWDKLLPTKCRFIWLNFFPKPGCIERRIGNYILHFRRPSSIFFTPNHAEMYKISLLTAYTNVFRSIATLHPFTSLFSDHWFLGYSSAQKRQISTSKQPLIGHNHSRRQGR